MSNQLKFKFKKKSKNTKIIIGLLLFFTSLFLFFSFNSFWFNWQLDDDTIRSGWNEISNLNSNKASNLLGWLGAYVSYFFISNLGLTSYGLVAILTLLSIKLTFNFKLNYYLVTKRIILFMMWLTIFLGISMKNIDLSGYTYGLAGLESYNILNLLIGDLGIIMLLTTWVIITIIVSNKLPSIKFKKPLFKSVNFSLPTKKEHTKNTKKFDPIQKNNSDIENTNESTKIEPDLKIKEQENEKTLTNLTPNFDPKLELSNYIFPSLDILKEYDNKIVVNKEELEQNKSIIIETLLHFKIEITAMNAEVGPTITLYEIVPKEGIKISKIKNLEDDIALSLAAEGIRIIAPIPGKGTIGIEVPNKNKNVVSMKEVISSEKFQENDMALPIAFGKTISNETFVIDLAKMPHLLMAGATGQGKSVGLNVILTSLLYKKHPAEIKFVLVDPKKVELTLFNKIERHFLAKLPDSEDAIITDTKKVVNTINSLCIEMDERYELCKKAQCRNIKEYNNKFISRKLNPNDGHKFLPYIVLVIDEFADLIMTAGKEIETPISRLAQLARAIGIHLIVATQRPSVNVITGLIKANFPARVAFRVTSKIDSRTILDAGGADQLIGMGDMLISTGSEMTRLQCAFVDTPEVDKLCEFIGSQKAYSEAHILPEYVGDSEGSSSAVDLNDRDTLFEEAARTVLQHQSGSTSLIQRKLKLGYNRAGRIIDQLEAAGIVGPFEGSKARQVLVKDELSLQEILNQLN